MGDLYKPMFGDRVYREISRKMGSDEAVAQYNRDLAQYEQAVALQKISDNMSNTNNTTTTSSEPLYYTPTEQDIKQLREDIEMDLYADKIEYGSPEYIKYGELRQNLNSTLNMIDYIELDIKAIIWLITIVDVFIGIPALLITSIEELKVAIIISLVLIPVTFMYLNHLIRKLTKKAQNIRKQKAKLVYDYKQTHQKAKLEPEPTTKTQTKPEKEVLTLQH